MIKMVLFHSHTENQNKVSFCPPVQLEVSVFLEYYHLTGVLPQFRPCQSLRSVEANIRFKLIHQQKRQQKILPWKNTFCSYLVIWCIR